MHWLAYPRAQKLSVVTADDRASATSASRCSGLSAPAPKPVAQQAVQPRSPTAVVKAALTGDPDTVYWAGPAADGGSCWRR